MRSRHPPPGSTPITIGESYMVHSGVLGQDRRLNIYLPPGYGQGDKAYPVLYLLDGGVAEDYLHIAGIATLAVDWRHMREFILVGIADGDRHHEMTPPTSVKGEQEHLPTAGGSAEFRRFIAEDVIPYVKTHYRVTDESVLMGESLAGLFVVETFLKKPHLFGGYVAISPSLWWNGQKLTKAAAALLNAPNFPANRRLYLTNAADDGPEMEEGMNRLIAAIQAHPPTGLSWSYHKMQHESHATTLHPAALYAVRQFFSTSK